MEEDAKVPDTPKEVKVKDPRRVEAGRKGNAIMQANKRKQFEEAEERLRVKKTQPH